MSENVVSFGYQDLYYSSHLPGSSDKTGNILDRPGKLAELLRAHDPRMKERVEQTFKQWNNVLRDYLRSETGFKLTIGSDVQAIPVRITDGLPRPFAEIIKQFDLQTLALLQKRPVLERTKEGLSYIKGEFESISSWTPLHPSPATYSEVLHVSEMVRKLTAELEKVDLLKKIFEIRHDILGAYFFRIPCIELYWMVIGFIAATIGVPVEALTIVIAIHELAHAYSHLGKDIDGRRWETNAFAETDVCVAEGLAQFYTSVICDKLQMRYPLALVAYKSLLKNQSDPYKVHEGWSKDEKDRKGIGEAVRFSMIMARTKDVKDYSAFDNILREQKELIKKSP